MGQYCNDPLRDAYLCASHDAWVTRTPDYDDEPEEEQEVKPTPRRAKRENLRFVLRKINTE